MITRQSFRVDVDATTTASMAICRAIAGDECRCTENPRLCIASAVYGMEAARVVTTLRRLGYMVEEREEGLGEFFAERWGRQQQALTRVEEFGRWYWRELVADVLWLLAGAKRLLHSRLGVL